MDEEMLLEQEEEDTQKNKYLTFKSGNEYFALQIRVVEEIISMQRITEIPETEDYIKGLINLRGKIIPVIDVRIRFKKEPIAYNDRTCIIIISVKGTVVGLIVETIAEVVTIEEDNITPPPALGHGTSRNKYVYGLGKVGNAVKMLLDPEKLIKDEEIVLLEQAAENAELEGEEGGTEDNA